MNQLLVSCFKIKREFIMKKTFLFLFLLSSTTVYAYEQDACQVMKNMASMLMTEYQQGFDIENYLQATSGKLSENQSLLLIDMISNAKQYQIYATDFAKEQAIENYANEWREDCERNIEPE
ncbi:hypothetical protein [Acinetobacter guillouiae]|uniref:hypothetical protein n=2 Tax=Moraxellaceae TaxID=468 RepID=UPI003AF8D94B